MTEPENTSPQTPDTGETQSAEASEEKAGADAAAEEDD